jgi:hypothetical protein
MNTTDSALQRALCKLLAEVFNGPEGSEAYILNPGDPGLLRQLDSISAAAASRRPAPGKPTIAAHAEHVLYGLSLLNRWTSGEENPWVTADWNAAWKREAVTEDEWRGLCGKLRLEADNWRKAAAQLRDLDDITAAGAISTVAHTAYHLGAIRQVLGVVRE